MGVLVNGKIDSPQPNVSAAPPAYPQPSGGMDFLGGGGGAAPAQPQVQAQPQSQAPLSVIVDAGSGGGMELQGGLTRRNGNVVLDVVLANKVSFHSLQFI